MNRKRFLRSMGLLTGGVVVGEAALPYETTGKFAEALNSASGQDDFWKTVRNQFLFPEDYVYLNTGGIGAQPKPTLEMVGKRMHDFEQYPKPGHDEPVWIEIKKKVAGFVGPRVDPSEIALTSTATEGINIILNGLDLKQGDEIITTTHEHVALNVPLLNHQRYTGIRIKFFEPDRANSLANVERVRELITDKTRLIFLSHITCTTGQILPVKEIADLAREKNILFAVDGAQAAGTMPIDLVELGISLYAACGHKWMLGPKRTGFLYVRKDLQDTVRPTTVGAYSDTSHDLEKGLLSFETTAERYEFGTQNEALFLGLQRSCEFLDAIGMVNVRDHNRKLSEKFYDGLGKFRHIERLSPAETAYRSSMIAFRFMNKSGQDAANYLTGQKRMRVRVVSEAGLNAVRASFHVYNQEEEVDRLLEAIRSMG